MPLWKEAAAADLVSMTRPVVASGPSCIGRWSLQHSLPTLCTGVRSLVRAWSPGETGVAGSRQLQTELWETYLVSWEILALTVLMGLGWSAPEWFHSLYRSHHLHKKRTMSKSLCKLCFKGREGKTVCLIVLQGSLPEAQNMESEILPF